MQAELCGALASPVRLYILDLLSEGEMTSAELLKILNIPKANLSQHLTVLKDVGILQARKEGLFQHVSLSTPKIKDACSMVRGILAERISQEKILNSEIVKELNAKK